MTKPPLGSHILALLMPITVAIIIPAWLVWGEESSSLNILERGGGVLLIILGFSLFAWTLRLFINIGKGTLAPWNATKNFIVSGPYKYCRNPMISGVLFVILGEALFFNSLKILIWGLVFFLVNTLYFVLIEEPNLAQKFGKPYENYQKQVPRWLPKLHH